MSVARRHSGPVLALLLAAIAFACPPQAWTQSAQVQWQGVDQVIAFADVHGAYGDLVTLLRETGILDAQDRWAAGRSHVVSLGDLLDRGAESRKVMDLLMRLQGEALAAGGQLHVLLGNHEAMNLVGDLRYVDASEFAPYVDLEPANEREQRRKLWQEQCAGSCAPFEQKFPPGYFGHRAAFAPGGRYGQWLLTLPVAIVINDTLFMHAGPSRGLQGLTLPELNLRYRTALVDFFAAAARLEQAKLNLVGDRRSAVRGLSTETLLREEIQRLEAAEAGPMLGETGPNWYRGPALCNEVTETDVLLPLLRQFGAARLVVGHTPTRDSRVVTRFDGRVVKLDTGMNRAVYKGRAAALFMQPSGLTVRYAGAADAVPPEPEGFFVAPNEVDDASVLTALRDGEVTVTGPRGPNELAVSVSLGGRSIPAVFLVRAQGAAHREVAAFRLDRLLQLGIVPGTVEREVQGQRGVLQARPLKWVTEAQVQQRQVSRGEGWCSAQPQFQLIYAFDTLIGNEGRAAESLLFDSGTWNTYVSAHERAFGTGRGLPAYLKSRPPAPGAELRRRLAALDEPQLRTSLGDLLDARELAAILARRDTLLALPVQVAEKSR